MKCGWQVSTEISTGFHVFGIESWAVGPATLGHELEFDWTPFSGVGMGFRETGIASSMVQATMLWMYA